MLGVECGCFDRVPSKDPGRRLNEASPVGEGRDASEIVGDVLFADQPDRNGPSVAVGQRLSKRRLEQKYSLGMVTQRPMPRVCKNTFRLVEPLMQVKVIFGPAA